MSEGEPLGSPRGSGGEYTLDDLIEHEKKNTRFVLVIFVVAVIFVSGKSFFSKADQPGASPATPARVTSSR